MWNIAIIYKIYNDINKKIYIGKTEYSIEQRFKQHCIDAFKTKCKNRPLYNAMKKYGINHFFIEEIEQTDDPNNREGYWIEYYDTYKNGYNATKGGEGTSCIDETLIQNLWGQGNTIKDIQKKTNYATKSIRKTLKRNKDFEKEKKERFLTKTAIRVAMIDKNTDEIIKDFSSMHEAGLFLNKVGAHRHISEVCNGKRKTAYGYKWKILDI